MVLVETDYGGWRSRRFYILALICQTIGINSILTLPNSAVTHGATGYILGCIIIFISIGIPLHYMEFIISQFTTRDCIDVWKIRPFLSHIGYFQMASQACLMIYNHILASFLFHYFLITFEKPIPYYICGRWATKGCDSLLHNYTVNQDCLKSKKSPSYCNLLHQTFPEYQYWRNYMLGGDNNLHIAWRCCLASAIITTILFFSCFKGKRSVRCFIAFFTIYPMVGYVIILVGSMQQKGIVSMYENAFDSDLQLFSSNMQFADMISRVLYALNIGVGISFNLGSSTSFRSPCYVNSVVTVIVCTVLSMLSICISAMMACPYAFEYGIRPTDITKYPITLGFERKPRLLHEYEHYLFWLLLSYSSDAVLAQNNNFILLLNFIEILAVRNSKVAKYPGLTCFIITLLIFISSIPLLGNIGAIYIPILRKYVNLITIFLVILECVVFVIWYGLSRICEDVHFMMGVPPSSFMKLAWISSIFVLCYSFSIVFYNNLIEEKERFGEKIIWWIFLFCLVLKIIIMSINLLVAAIKKEFRNAIQLDPTWGPNTDVLMRSRAMFSAQAMTKEYMYRQYHLQAGIYERQRRSNVRRSIILDQ